MLFVILISLFFYPAVLLVNSLVNSLRIETINIFKVSIFSHLKTLISFSIYFSCSRNNPTLESSFFHLLPAASLPRNPSDSLHLANRLLELNHIFCKLKLKPSPALLLVPTVPLSGLSSGSTISMMIHIQNWWVCYVEQHEQLFSLDQHLYWFRV